MSIYCSSASIGLFHSFNLNTGSYLLQDSRAGLNWGFGALSSYKFIIVSNCKLLKNEKRENPAWSVAGHPILVLAALFSD